MANSAAMESIPAIMTNMMTNWARGIADLPESNFQNIGPPI